MKNKKKPAPKRLRERAVPKGAVSMTSYIPVADRASIQEWQDASRNLFNPKPTPGHVISAMVSHCKATHFLKPTFLAQENT